MKDDCCCMFPQELHVSLRIKYIVGVHQFSFGYSLMYRHHRTVSQDMMWTQCTLAKVLYYIQQAIIH